VAAIDRIQMPKTVKGVQSFFGQINFVRRFVPNFAETTRNISKMMKKDATVHWEREAIESF